MFLLKCLKNNTHNLEQLSPTGNLNANLILRQHKLYSVARFMEIKSVNPNLRHDQITKQLGCSKSTLERYSQDIEMQCAFKSNNLERPQNTSNDLQ